MKVRDCNACKKQVFKEAKEEFLKHEYSIMKDMSYTFACHATAACLMAMTQRGRSKEYIQKLFDDIVMVFDTSELFGKPIILTDVMKNLEKDYGIDFKRLHVTIESERDFVRDIKRS